MMNREQNIKDMNIIDFARSISMLSVDTPISNEFDMNYGQKENRWWTCQREHLTVWCIHQPTEGVQRFFHKPNNSASFMYNNFKRPETLLWLLEAIGEDKDVLIDIVSDIKGMNHCQSACAHIREKISFDRIYDLVQKLDKD